MDTQKRAELVFLPDWSQDNPYQKLLYGEISHAGIPCRGLRGDDFTVSWLFSNRSSCRFIHLHWLFGVYDPERKGLTLHLAGNFLMKLILARILGYQLIWTVHNFVSHEPSNLKLELLVRKAVAKLANAVVAHCNYAKGLVVDNWNVPAEKVAVIPHGSYFGYYPNTVNRNEARERLGIDADEFVYLFFGMLRGYKGVKPLIQSFKEVLVSNPDARLVIAGKPFTEAIRKELEEEAGGKSISLFLRFIPDEEIQYFFNACDVVVLPYQNVLTSGAAILALSFNVPFVVPAKGCMPELAAEGLCIVYEDEEQLADAMTSAREQKSNFNMDKFEEQNRFLSWANLVKIYYLKILKEKAR